MYIMINTIGQTAVTAGDILVLKTDRAFGAVGAFDIGSGIVGYVANSQPDGCIDSRVIYANINNSRILCRVIVVTSGMVILHTDSKVLESEKSYTYTVKENYGILKVK